MSRLKKYLFALLSIKNEISFSQLTCCAMFTVEGSQRAYVTYFVVFQSVSSASEKSLDILRDIPNPARSFCFRPSCMGPLIHFSWHIRTFCVHIGQSDRIFHGGTRAITILSYRESVSVFWSYFGCICPRLTWDVLHLRNPDSSHLQTACWRAFKVGMRDIIHKVRRTIAETVNSLEYNQPKPHISAHLPNQGICPPPPRQVRVAVLSSIDESRGCGQLKYDVSSWEKSHAWVDCNMIHPSCRLQKPDGVLHSQDKT